MGGDVTSTSDEEEVVNSEVDVDCGEGLCTSVALTACKLVASDVDIL